MTNNEQHELLIRLDERTERMDRRMDSFALKSEVLYLKRGFWGVVCFVFVAMGGALLKLIGLGK